MAVAVHPKVTSQPVLVHGLASLQSRAVPVVQTALWQVSVPLQTLPSLHEVPFRTGALAQPVAGAQLSVVQMLPSLQSSGATAVHMPPWQVSLPLHRSVSAHGVPLGAGGVVQPNMGSQPSAVHGAPSLQASGVPAVHTALWQVSPPLQTLPSLHEVPFRTGALAQPVAGAQLSVVHGLPSLQIGTAPGVQLPPWHVSLPLQKLVSAHEEPLGSAVV
jgi:hypothetical protein